MSALCSTFKEANNYTYDGEKFKFIREVESPDTVGGKITCTYFANTVDNTVMLHVIVPTRARDGREPELAHISYPKETESLFDSTNFDFCEDADALWFLEDGGVSTLGKSISRALSHEQHSIDFETDQTYDGIPSFGEVNQRWGRINAKDIARIFPSGHCTKISIGGFVPDVGGSEAAKPKWAAYVPSTPGTVNVTYQILPIPSVVKEKDLDWIRALKVNTSSSSGGGV